MDHTVGLRVVVNACRLRDAKSVQYYIVEQTLVLLAVVKIEKIKKEAFF